MKERKLPKADGAGSEVFVVPSPSHHTRETLSAVGAEIGPGQAFKALDVSLENLTPKSPENHWKYKALFTCLNKR